MVLPVRSNKGFTLIEMMIAMVIIMVSMLALLTSITVSMRTTLQNDLRDTAIRLTNQTAEAILALPIDDPELTVQADTHERTSSASQTQKGFPGTLQTVRGSRKTYAIGWNVTAPSANIKRVVITVSYLFSNQTFTNEAFVDKHSSL